MQAGVLYCRGLYTNNLRHILLTPQPAALAVTAMIKGARDTGSERSDQPPQLSIPAPRAVYPSGQGSDTSADAALATPTQSELGVASSCAPLPSGALASYPPGAGLAGLINLGNTCFFAAGLQALSHVPPLAAFATEADFVATGALDPRGGRPAPPLHSLFRQLLQDQWMAGGRGDAALRDTPAAVAAAAVVKVARAALRPDDLLVALRRANGMFGGFAQQDAHEALRTLLNDMHEKSAVAMPVGLYTSYLNAYLSRGEVAKTGATRKRTTLTGTVSTRRRLRSREGGIGTIAPDAACENSNGPPTNDSLVDSDADSVEPQSSTTNQRGIFGTSASAAVPTEQTAAPQLPLGQETPTLVAPVARRGVSAGTVAAAGAAMELVGTPQFVPPLGREWLVDGPYTGPETVQRSIISDLFGGVMCSRVRCRTCGTDSVTYDTFYDLSLSLPRQSHPATRGQHVAAATGVTTDATSAAAVEMKESAGLAVDAAAAAWISAGPVIGASDAPATAGSAPAPSSSAGGGFFTRVASMVSRMFVGGEGNSSGSGSSGVAVSLSDALYSFCEWEPLTGADQYHCDVCGAKRDADKRVGIAALPEVLLLQLKRFSYGGGGGWGGGGNKNCAPVSFPMKGLDLAPFVGVGGTPQAAAVRLYTRAREQQAGRRLVPHHGGAGFSPQLTQARPVVGAADSSSGDDPDTCDERQHAEKVTQVIGREVDMTLSLPPPAVAADASPTVAVALTGPSRRPAVTTPTARAGGTGVAEAVERPVKGSAGGAGGNTSRRVVDFMPVDVRDALLHRASIATGATGVERVAAAAAAAAGSGIIGPPPPMPPPPASQKSPTADGVVEPSLPDWLCRPVPVPLDRVTSPACMGDTHYELASIVQHMGGVSGGHYVTHACHRANGQWYTFDDSNVSSITADEAQRREAYLLFYVRSRSPTFSRVSLPPAAPNEVPAAYVSRAWWLRYNWLSVPGPITNADILCDHGGIKRQLAERLSSLVVALTASQFETLARAYGAAEPPLTQVHACADCKIEAAALKARRARERQRIMAVDTAHIDGAAGEMWYIVSEVWLAKWRGFIDNLQANSGEGSSRMTLCTHLAALSVDRNTNSPLASAHTGV